MALDIYDLDLLKFLAAIPLFFHLIFVSATFVTCCEKKQCWKKQGESSTSSSRKQYAPKKKIATNQASAAPIALPSPIRQDHDFTFASRQSGGPASPVQEDALQQQQSAPRQPSHREISIASSRSGAPANPVQLDDTAVQPHQISIASSQRGAPVNSIQLDDTAVQEFAPQPPHQISIASSQRGAPVHPILLEDDVEQQSSSSSPPPTPQSLPRRSNRVRTPPRRLVVDPKLKRYGSVVTEHK